MATIDARDFDILAGLIIQYYERTTAARDTEVLLAMCGLTIEESRAMVDAVSRFSNIKNDLFADPRYWDRVPCDDASPQDASFNHPGCGDVGDLSIDAHACDGCEFFVDEIEVDSTSGMSFHRPRCIAQADDPCSLETGEDIDGLPF
jgi:hypothetical protein